MHRVYLYKDEAELLVPSDTRKRAREPDPLVIYFSFSSTYLVTKKTKMLDSFSGHYQKFTTDRREELEDLLVKAIASLGIFFVLIQEFSLETWFQKCWR